MLKYSFLVLGLLAAKSSGQGVGTQKAESHLPLSLTTCTSSQACSTQQLSVTLDSNWRWMHSQSIENCYTGNAWNSEYCSDAASCTRNCVIEGVTESDWNSPYGIHALDNGLKLDFVTRGQYGTNIGSRVYLLDESQERYKLFKLKNKEFTFDVDVSELPCGLNGALYFVEMDADGGASKFSENKAGAKYGIGYCDAQCPHDLKWIHGEANVLHWKPHPKDPNSGAGLYGACCAEMDIWEANSQATAFTAHPCSLTSGNYRCQGTECGDNDSGNRYHGVCDKDGCDMNAFRLGDEKFFGAGSEFKLNSLKPMTVVTQFLTSDNTDSGDLVEIRRLWVQDGKVFQNAQVNVPGLDNYNSISDQTCSTQKRVFNETDSFSVHGGLKVMGEAMERGMVLVMSLWDDHDVNMLWLDSDYPLTESASAPGVHRGPCSRDSGKPTDVEKIYASSNVKFSNIRFGAIGSTLELARLVFV